MFCFLSLAYITGPGTQQVPNKCLLNSDEVRLILKYLAVYPNSFYPCLCNCGVVQFMFGRGKKRVNRNQTPAGNNGMLSTLRRGGGRSGTSTLLCPRLHKGKTVIGKWQGFLRNWDKNIFLHLVLFPPRKLQFNGRYTKT